MKKLKQVLSKTLGISENLITDETSPENVDTWDSFAGLMLVSELEAGFGVKFTMDEVISARSVKDIKENLRKHGIDIQENN